MSYKAIAPGSPCRHNILDTTSLAGLQSHEFDNIVDVPHFLFKRLHVQS